MRKWIPDRTTLFLIGVALVLAVIAWVQGGAEKTLEGLVNGGRTLLSVTPLLLAAFLLAGLVQVLVSREVIERWLGSRSGWRGILLACLAGALIPGGPYVYYPLAGALLHSGAGIGALMAFVIAKNLWSVTRLPFEFALLGSHLTLVRYGLTLVIPPLLGMMAETLFGRYINRIREAAG
ncbi:MAG: permease [Anaerolineaceae bacterium]|nr:MAG: permease [Anaerolineaceae bacterium]